MSVQDQIDAAWKARCNGWDLGSTARVSFEAGYIAGLRSLFVEVKPEDARAGVDYWVLRNGRWSSAWWFSDELTRQKSKECERILYFNPISPSGLFTEGRA